MRPAALRFLRPLGALLALLLAGCAAIPPPSGLLNYASAPRAVAPEDRPAFNTRVYDQAADWVARRYYDPALNGIDWSAARARHRPAALAATDDTGLYAALNALLDELHDEHTCALTPAEVEQYRQRRSALLGFRTGPVADNPTARRILSVFPGSAAALAGVRPGWIIVATDGRPPGEVLGVGKLADGQLVRCDFLDLDGAPHHLELRAALMRYPTTREARRLADGTLLLEFDTFDLTTARWLRAQLKQERPATLLLDLRDNSGGEARALAAIVAELFPERATIGRIRSRQSGDDSQRLSPRHPFAAHYAGPLAVLVSERTASAAEILAAIVQHERRGVVVGTATPGIVLVSVNWPLPGGGELQLSVYDYAGPDGRRLEGRGVAPDLPVATAPGAQPDPQVGAALQWLQNRP